MLCKNPCAWAVAIALALGTLFGLLTGGGSSGSGSSAPAGNDYSAILADDLPDSAKKDFVTFQDNAGDKSALQTALNQLTPDAAAALQNGQAVQVYSTTSGYGGAASSLTSALGLVNPTLKGGNTPGGAYNGLVNNASSGAAQTAKYGLLFAAPASLNLNTALQQVANQVDLILEDLPASNAPATPAYSYRYNISTSVASHDAPAASGQSAVPANYILVTITRTATAGAASSSSSSSSSSGTTAAA